MNNLPDPPPPDNNSPVVPPVVPVSPPPPVPPAPPVLKASPPVNPPAVSTIDEDPYPASDYAGFWRRFFAVLIDGIITGILIFIVVFPLAFLLGFTTMLNQKGADRAFNSFQPFANGLGFLLSALFNSFFLSSKGATPGKMALGIKVITVDGQKLTFGRALLRELVGKWLSGLIFALGYLWMLWDNKKQTWHDKIANTIVVRV